MFGARPALGPELIPNADFSAGAANWTVGGIATFADGEVSFNGPTNGAANLFSSKLTEAGKSYLIEIDITASAGSVFYYNDDAVWVPLPDISVGSHQVLVHFASIVQFGIRASGLFVGKITRFSAREKLT